MSRFQIDKFMSFVEGSDQAVLDYVADPVTYVSTWEQRASAVRLPTVDSGSFTDEERAAFITMDHATLYRLGAHPYVLWHFVEAIRVWAGDVGWPDMKERYRADVAAHDTPDFST